MSLIIPCKNEQDNIENIVNEARIKLRFPYQLVFIDDLSNDETYLRIKNSIKINQDLNIKLFLEKVGNKSCRYWRSKFRWILLCYT